MTRKYHITTFGCQMNVYDSEMMEGIIASRGWERAGSEAEADLILYNTCVVREGAEQRAMGRLAQLAALKRANPALIVGVTGCMAQKEAERLFEALPHLDLILGTRAIPRLGPMLDRVLATGERQVCTEILDDSFVTDVVPIRQRPLKALVNIILGCNKNCSYCIVPQTRGREVSQAPEKIIAEARSLAEHGYKELTLVGQNVNSYKGVNESGEPVDFGGLLRSVSAACPDLRIRYITSHPRDCNEAHISAVAESPGVCENFHLPVQSGSTRVLRKMYRGYSRERYLRLVDKVRSAIPDATLSTDIIVGFPTETDDDFRETMSLMEEVRFDSAYMYMYSPRSGTRAAADHGEHSIEVKKARLAELIERQEAIQAEINRDLIGTRFEVLVEDSAPRTPGDLLARTRGDKMVIIPGPADWIGGLMEVEITEANGHTLHARAVENGVENGASRLTAQGALLG